MKIKWKVIPKETGRFASFNKRGWPSAWYIMKYGREEPAAMLSCEDGYTYSIKNSGEHRPLIMHIADYSVIDGRFRWRRVKEEFKTYREAVKILSLLIEKFPHLKPKEEADDSQSKVS